MNIIEAIKNRILKFLGLDEISYNPYSERLTYIGNPDEILAQNISEARVWYIGDSNELLNYYTNEQMHDNHNEAVYNRNRSNYFWGISSQEANIKRVHSGLPKAIVDTLTNAIGFPTITAKYQGKEVDVPMLLEALELKKKTMQEQMPLTMAIGYGAWKINIDPDFSKSPILEYYEAKDVEFIAKYGKIIGVIFKDYYKYDRKNYLLLDTRHLDKNGDSVMDFELFEMTNRNDVKPVSLSTIPELAHLADKNKSKGIKGYKRILAVPCRFLFDPNNPNYGKSIYAGRYDLFDDLDQSLSQRSQTSRVSTPVEYYPVDMLERSKRDGSPTLPSVYNRQYVKKEGIPDGNGNVDSMIQTTQPQLNFAQYNEEQREIVSMILNGLLSPATMGIDLARKDNAEAQREKEKVTIMTRDNIIAQETEILKSLIRVCLDVQAYINTGLIPLDDSDTEISVKFNQFANPSFESLSQTLSPMLANGTISVEMYVDKLYGDSLSEEEKQKEIEALKANQSRDDLEQGDFDSDKVGESDQSEKTELKEDDTEEE